MGLCGFQRMRNRVRSSSKKAEVVEQGPSLPKEDPVVLEEPNEIPEENDIIDSASDEVEDEPESFTTKRKKYSKRK